jgi:protein-arginine kinase
LANKRLRLAGHLEWKVFAIGGRSTSRNCPKRSKQAEHKFDPLEPHQPENFILICLSVIGKQAKLLISRHLASSNFISKAVLPAMVSANPQASTDIQTPQIKGRSAPQLVLLLVFAQACFVTGQ